MSYDPKLPACPLCEGRPQVIRCEDGSGWEVFCGCGLSKRSDTSANGARMDWITLCSTIRNPGNWQDYQP